jgi:Uma2 family endonuclease
MNDNRILTAERFAETKFDLPEGGRWVELVAGEVVHLHPPDDAHGTTVLNLSKALAEFAQESQVGYACFELGLIVTRDPDTVRCPAVSYFLEGERFAMADATVTDARPALVVEIASTNDRRRDMRYRVEQYMRWGVDAIWVADPTERQVHVSQKNRPTQRLAGHETLLGHPVLSGFSIQVGDLFAEPDWWRGG